MTSRHSRAHRARHTPPVPSPLAAAPAHDDAAPRPWNALGAVVRRSCLPLAVTATLVLGAQPATAAPQAPSPAPDTPATTVPSNPPTETDRVIVKFKDTAAPEATKEKVVERATEDALDAARAPEATGHVKTTAGQADVIKLDRELDEGEQKKVLTEIQADPAVEYAEADRLATTSWVPNDTYTNFQWSLWPNQGGVDFTRAWDLSRGTGQRIAVLDTGITSHGDLNSKVVPGRDFINDTDLSRDGTYRDANPQDEGDWSGAGECSPAARSSSWHGTHVAGLAAGVTQNGAGISGAAPGAQIQPVRVLGKCTNGWVSDIADAVVWAAGAPVAGQPVNPNPSTVLNLSLNYPGECGWTMQNAINTAVNRRVPVVVAAGNSAVNAGGTAPANCENTIVVGASDNNGNTAGYSNTGAVVDILAPGGTDQFPMLSTVNAGTTRPAGATYGNMYGTSMATPLVSGTVALMKQRDPAITPARVEQILTSTASGRLGSRNLNPAAAVRAVAPVPSGYTASGEIGKKWRATGGAAKWGNPTNKESNAANGGRYQAFQKNGYVVRIYWSSATGANIVQTPSPIGKKFVAKGYEHGYGYPSSDERGVTGGAYQVFRNGSALYKTMWSAGTGANTVKETGAIGTAWKRAGYEKGWGWPTTEERAVTGGTYQAFRSGSAQYRTLWSPRTGAHTVKETGAIGGAWKRAGLERGWGWPVTDEYRSGAEMQQKFSHGVTAHWTSQRGVWTTR